MREVTTKLGLLLALAVLGLIGACDDKSPVRPTPLPPQGPSGPTLLRLEIIGPRSIPPGETIQYGVTGHFSDGSSRSVNAEAYWNSAKNDVVPIDATGHATGRQLGESDISVHVGAVRSTTEVVVVPPETYRLVAVVQEAGSIFLEGVRVEVLEGRGAGLSTTALVDGRYALYGVAGNTLVRVTGRGYREHLQRINVLSHTTITVEMAPEKPRAAIAGDYVLTITAAANCRDLPSEVGLRRYSATVTQLGPEIWVKLGGGDFLTRNQQGNGFGGRLDADNSKAVFGLAAGLVDYYYYRGFAIPPDVVERLSATQYLNYIGGATVSVTERRMSGTLDGQIRIIDMPTPWGFFSTVANCSSRHSFELTR